MKQNSLVIFYLIVFKHITQMRVVLIKAFQITIKIVMRFVAIDKYILA